MAQHETPPPDGTAPDPHPGYDRVAARETVVMYNALAYVLAGPLTFGPVGWGLDQLLGTSFLLPSASWRGWHFRCTSCGSGTVRSDSVPAAPARSRHA